MDLPANFAFPIKATCRCVALLLLLMLTICDFADGQRHNVSRKAVYMQVTIQGKVIAQHKGLPVAGIRYIEWGLGAPADTAITDASGAFILKISTAERQNLKRGVRLGVREPMADSLAFSISDDLRIRSDTSVAQLTVYRYPRATLINGDISGGNFHLPLFGKKGNNDLQQFLVKELRYPDDARENGTEGKVLTRFLIDEKGAILAPEIVRSAGYSLDHEVLRLLGKMPAWSPGSNNGKPAAMYYYLPVTFMLD